MTKVILNSGGMDSFLLANAPWWGGCIHVFVDIGQAYVAKERASAIKIAEDCGTALREVKGAQIAFFETGKTS